jgi:phosphatidylinositol 4-kinase
MQSAAKCPILVAFRCEQSDELGSHEKVQACIFKVGDDCRQDVLALQVMRLMKNAFDAAHLPLYLAPYGVVPTGHEQGIIEVIPQAKSRAQLGEMFDGGLFEIFQHEFGMPGARRFEAARQNFLESTAAYSVATYILWAKDRHNGNLMLDNQGRFLHIDFGYILGISPGGNLGFETAPFKLSYEMTQLLDPGASRASPTFRRFMELTVRGFLASRSVADSVCAAVALMAPSQVRQYAKA